MANRRLMAGIPIWVKVPGIIALVLVGVLLSTMLLGASSVGDSHSRSRGTANMTNHNKGGSGGNAALRGHTPSQGASHDPGDETQMRNHGEGRAHR
jgi:hypothetical protein